MTRDVEQVAEHRARFRHNPSLNRPQTVIPDPIQSTSNPVRDSWRMLEIVQVDQHDQPQLCYSPASYASFRVMGSGLGDGN